MISSNLVFPTRSDQKDVHRQKSSHRAQSATTRLAGVSCDENAEEKLDTAAKMTAFISLMALSERRTRKEKPRLAISKEIFNSLCRRAQQYSVKPSRLAEDVIEHYLAEMQRALFGQVGADKVLPVPAEARAIDAIIFASASELPHEVQPTLLIKFVIYGLVEGVLFDSVTFQRVAAIQMFSEDWQVHGRVEDFPSMAEIPREASISRFAGKCHIDGFDLVRAKQGVEERYVEKYCVPGVLPSVDGAFNLVARLRKLGLKTAILTEASTEVVSASMEAVGFSNNLPFDEVSSR